MFEYFADIAGTVRIMAIIFELVFGVLFGVFVYYDINNFNDVNIKRYQTVLFGVLFVMFVLICTFFPSQNYFLKKAHEYKNSHLVK